MIKIRYNRRALCAGDDAKNGIYNIQLPDDAVLSDLMDVVLHGGNGNDWPIPWGYHGWLIHSNIGKIAEVSSDFSRIDYCVMDENLKLTDLGIEWVFGEYEGTDPDDTAFKCKCLFRQ